MTNEPVSREVGKQLVGLLGLVLFTVVSVKVQRAASKPDFGRTFAMRNVLVVKRFADGQARMWEKIATNAANRYNSLKP